MGKNGTRKLPPNIYIDEKTGKYKVKYNYKEYDPKTGKNKYKQKWVYGIETLGEAKTTLAQMVANGIKVEDKDITINGAYELWKVKATAQKYSQSTLHNTQEQIRMIGRFVSLDTKIKDIDEDFYYKLIGECREHGYSEETIHSINATFRKLINLTYKKRLIHDNPLHRSDGIKTEQNKKVNLISWENFQAIDTYFAKKKFVRLGVDTTPLMRLMFNILYYTGIRIGECLALTWDDFEEFSYYKKGEAPIRLVPSSMDAGEPHLQGMRVIINKTYLSDWNTVKGTKNKKDRKIPLDPSCEYRFLKARAKYCNNGSDRIFNWKHSNCQLAIKKACEVCGITPRYTCHDFRHTFISNMIKEGVPIPVIEKVSGDTQETILKRYSHMFEQDEILVLQAIQRVKENQ